MLVGMTLAALALVGVALLIRWLTARLVIPPEPHVVTPNPGDVAGRLVTASGNTDLARIGIWLVYRDTVGQPVTLETASDDVGQFTFDLAPEATGPGRVGAVVLGVEPIDIDLDMARFPDDEIVLVVDDLIPSHIRFA